MYSFGGSQGDGSVASVYRYHLENDYWERLNNFGEYGKQNLDMVIVPFN